MDWPRADRVIVPSSPSTPDTPTRKRTVRIVRPRKTSKAGTISIVLSASAAVLVLVARQAFQQDEAEPPFQRTLADVEMEWRCEAGHLFRASGQVGARKCWTCGRPAFAFTRFSCPQHGEFEVAVEFEATDPDVHRPAKLRVERGPWVPFEEGAACPRCHRKMSRAAVDPLQNLKPRKP